MSIHRLAGMLVALCLLTTARAAADALPRYKLKVGQELIYHTSRSDTEDTRKPSGLDADCHVWVLSQTKERGWRLLFRESESCWTGTDKKVVSTDHNLGYCTLFPDGRFIAPRIEPGFFIFDPIPLFPHLPNQVKKASHWDGADDRDGSRVRYTRNAKAGHSEDLWNFTGVRTTPLDKLYFNKWQADYSFDLSCGLVVKGTISSSTDNGPKSVTSLQLRSVQEVKGDTVLQLESESEVLLNAAKAYQELMDQAEPSLDKELITKAGTVLTGAYAKLTVPMLREKVEAVHQLHGKLAEIYARMAADRARMIGKPSPQWEARDLDGKPIALKDYQGKVVVLDFWGRWCGACMQGMPDINRLADDFKDEAVAVLAMCANRTEKDARLVVDKMGIRYPTIMAADLCEKYHVTSFPRLIVLDGKGTVREIYFGYQPALHGQVSKIIRKLLTEAKTGTAE